MLSLSLAAMVVSIILPIIIGVFALKISSKIAIKLFAMGFIWVVIGYVAALFVQDEPWHTLLLSAGLAMMVIHMKNKYISMSENTED